MFYKIVLYYKQIDSFGQAKNLFLWFRCLKNAKEVKMENLKKMAGIKAAEFVTDGMVVGLKKIGRAHV